MASTRVLDASKEAQPGGGDKGRTNMTFLKRAFGSQLDLTDGHAERRNDYRTVESQTDCQLFFIGAPTDGAEDQG